MALIASDTWRVIVGLGKTGYSCARYLHNKGVRFAVMDTREDPPLASEFRQEFPDVILRCGALDEVMLNEAREIILSPGISMQETALQRAAAQGVSIIGDIDLFCRETTAPIVAITGSNAKTTVTTLVGEMAKEAGVRVAVGGNIGTPVLDLLQEEAIELYVIELSSFQLETTHELAAAAATILNISADHMDRYAGLEAYHRAKQRIYRGCQFSVYNRDDALTQPLLALGMQTTTFGMSAPDLKDYGVKMLEGERWIFRGQEPLLPIQAIPLQGDHNVANAMAAMALAAAVNIPMQAIKTTLQQFKGLQHRCQWVRCIQEVDYINDSKATNVGATIAAIEGMGKTLASGAKIIIILGGQGKAQAFASLNAVLQNYVRSVILIGEDAKAIAQDLQGVPMHFDATLEEAVIRAHKTAQPQDKVLLSPACASFDMYSGYEARGQHFIDIVEALR